MPLWGTPYENLIIFFIFLLFLENLFYEDNDVAWISGKLQDFPCYPGTCLGIGEGMMVVGEMITADF